MRAIRVQKTLRERRGRVLRGLTEGHESEATTLAGALVSHDRDINNVAVLAKILLDILLYKIT